MQSKSKKSVCKYVGCIAVHVCMHACVRVCVNCVLIQQKYTDWCAGTRCKRYSAYVGNGKYLYGLEGKAIAFLWPAEILVVSR